MMPIRFVLLVMLAIALPRSGRATDDDITVDADTIIGESEKLEELELRQPIRMRIRVGVHEEFEEKLFEKDRTAQRGEWRINSEIQMALGYLDRACGLTDPQRGKLELAARVDRQRFCDRVADARSKWHSDSHRTTEYHAEVFQLGRLVKYGVLNQDSFFAKLTQRVLTQEQIVRLDRHRRAIQEALIEKCLGKLALKSALKESQRTALVALLAEETVPPRDFGHCEHLIRGPQPRSSSEPLYANDELFLMTYRLFELGAQVKALLEPEQWREVWPKLVESRGAAQLLVDEDRLNSAPVSLRSGRKLELLPVGLNIKESP